MPDPSRRTVTAPGLQVYVTSAEYHADPCPEPSLSRSVAKLLIDRTPRHAFIAHPRLSATAETEPSVDRFNLGTVAHKLILGRGSDYREVEADNWTTKAAKEKRDEIRAAGMTPILTGQLARANAMTVAVLNQLPAFGIERLFDAKNGRAEVMAASLDPIAGWMRCLFDWLEKDLTMWDVKTTGVPLSEDSLGRLCAAMGYEFQAAFYERVVTAIHPELRGRAQFNFLFVEDDEPYAALPVRLPAEAMAKGHANVQRACLAWAAAKKSGEWPMFSGDIRTLVYPPWQIAEWMEFVEGKRG